MQCGKISIVKSERNEMGLFTKESWSMLQVNISGKSAEIHAFVSYLKEQAFFQVNQNETKQEVVGIDEMETVSLDLTTNLLKPTIRKVFTVKMKTDEGKEFNIVLLDGVYFKVGESTIIKGKNYDIFHG